ncbi:MAG: hypothetical protein AVO39_00860 [delta proteobacterium MLS_D]|nr:MAG: hypothetical protein AVO39_00860 [delta proteobacterium MLS_D]
MAVLFHFVIQDVTRNRVFFVLPDVTRNLPHFVIPEVIRNPAGIVKGLYIPRGAIVGTRPA